MDEVIKVIYNKKALERGLFAVLGKGGATKEAVANFVGARLFAEDGSTLEKLINSLNPSKKQSFLDWIKDFIEKLKRIFTKSSDKRIQNDIKRFEDMFIKIYNKAQNDFQNKNTPTEEAGVKYSADNEVVDLSLDKELINRIDNSKKSPITVIKDYIFEKLGGKDIELSDGIIAIVDKSDAKHLANSSKSKAEKAMISEIERIIKLAKFYDDVAVVHNKFNRFRYYELPIKYNNEITFLTLNVGLGKTDNKYHIYDFTEPKERNTPNRINGFGSPVGNSLRKGVSTTNIPSTEENVNTQNSIPDTKAENEDIRYAVSDAQGGREAELQQLYRSGDITQEEYELLINKRRGNTTPGDIIKTPKSEADTTPELARRTGKATGDGESKFYDSIQDSDILSEDFKAGAKTNDFIKRYERIANKETMKDAADALDTGGRSYVNSWFAKKPTQFSAEDVCVGFILLDRYQKVKDIKGTRVIGIYTPVNFLYANYTK